MRTPHRAVGSTATPYRGNGSWNDALSDDLTIPMILPAAQYRPTPDRGAAANLGGKTTGIRLPCPSPWRHRIETALIAGTILAVVGPIALWLEYALLSLIITGGHG
jgi:hypothetical protein